MASVFLSEVYNSKSRNLSIFFYLSFDFLQSLFDFQSTFSILIFGKCIFIGSLEFKITKPFNFLPSFFRQGRSFSKVEVFRMSKFFEGRSFSKVSRTHIALFWIPFVNFYRSNRETHWPLWSRTTKKKSENKNNTKDGVTLMLERAILRSFNFIY